MCAPRSLLGKSSVLPSAATRWPRRAPRRARRGLTWCGQAVAPRGRVCRWPSRAPLGGRAQRLPWADCGPARLFLDEARSGHVRASVGSRTPIAGWGGRGGRRGRRPCRRPRLPGPQHLLTVRRSSLRWPRPRQACPAVSHVGGRLLLTLRPPRPETQPHLPVAAQEADTPPETPRGRSSSAGSAIGLRFGQGESGRHRAAAARSM